jgi:hypothetical protein
METGPGYSDKNVERGMNEYMSSHAYIEFPDGATIVLPKQAMIEPGFKPGQEAATVDTEDQAFEGLLDQAINPSSN